MRFARLTARMIEPPRANLSAAVLFFARANLRASSIVEKSQRFRCVRGPARENYFSVCSRACRRVHKVLRACAGGAARRRARPQKTASSRALFAAIFRTRAAPSAFFLRPFFVRRGTAMCMRAGLFDANAALFFCACGVARRPGWCASMRRQRAAGGDMRTGRTSFTRHRIARKSDVSKKFLLDESMHCKCADAISARAAASRSAPLRATHRHRTSALAMR